LLDDIAMHTRPRLLLATLLLACGGDQGPVAGTEGSTTARESTSEASTSGGTTAEPATSDATTTTTTIDPDGSSGGPPAGTPGCGLAVEPGETTVELEVGESTREYILVVPTGYDPDTPLPLVFGFHGLGSNAAVSRLYFQIEQAADGQAIFVYPEGLPLGSEGGLTGWDLAPTGIDVALFDAILAEVSEGLCIDPQRVFASGHSFGGYMSNALGCFRASVLRAIAPVAGGPPLDVCEDDTVAGWMAHGVSDGIVPFVLGELARDSLLDRNGCEATTTAVEPAPCVAYDDCAADMPVVWCAHEETELSGHMWPRFAGPAIWAFFDAVPPKA
jgi:polyhydroxybutyrate depolymerase